MSRTIDMSSPDTWSDDDIQYLKDRCLIPADYAAEEITADIGYEEMLKADLVELAEKRELDSDGTRAEIIARLEEADAAAESGE